MSEWISVKDKLPELEREYRHYDQSNDILVTDGACVYFGIFQKTKDANEIKTWFNTGTSDELYGVTHWMPIPELPEIKNPD